MKRSMLTSRLTYGLRYSRRPHMPLAPWFTGRIVTGWPNRYKHFCGEILHLKLGHVVSANGHCLLHDLSMPIEGMTKGHGD